MSAVLAAASSVLFEAKLLFFFLPAVASSSINLI
jgi:hypothetical protein